ncbi:MULTISPECIES: hypothetical protein [Methylobacterium]|jgi:hypothetical protein|uniref:Cyclin-dependent kinase inhibitor 1C (P57, Kip2) n=2 Tax=Methylobacterium TaxID=407 RepID=A0A089Q532_9HYPH|nr:MULTISPECIES: hypothetical protein [Methylobacterium]KOX47001.1 hypothetical protein ADL19_22540 [Streptomyces purpurogeneiscleroticus]AIQ89689.1 Cyclin-dependent kinase inhibitor 1C (P57, Kip2) [Methylobacterium oryzae CBMB20]AWV18035.1 hypothetical protein A3862_23075 [Methylobacterium sp. XJLW]MBA9066114.1 hypothetical protein [Methylobacterium fujisawaense]MBP29820.1 hypothetical protein [Methylobacterium sp.]
MIRFLAASAACLVLCGAAAAQDMPGLATLHPPDPAQPVAASAPVPMPDGGVAPGLRLGSVPDPDAARPDPVPTPPGSLALRSTAADAAQTTASLKAPSATPKPWCAQERRVGTGLGFCLVN